MPQIGWFEILIIVAISIVVIGPKDFPYMLKKVQNQISTLENENFDSNKDLEKTKSTEKEKKNER